MSTLHARELARSSNLGHCRLQLTDLSPNVGLWWYFFIEMFDHFRPFFLAIFSVCFISYLR